MDKVVELAAERQGVRYCGDSSAVSVSYSSILMEYFGRGLWGDGGVRPAWVEVANGHGGSVLAVAAALRLTGIEFDPAVLVRAAGK